LVAITAAVLAMDLGGCMMVGPDYVRPEADVNPSRLESNRLQVERQQEIVAKRARLAAVERKIAGIVAAIEDGSYNKSLTERLGALESEQEVLERELAQSPAVRQESAEIREWWTAFDDPASVAIRSSRED
jgi:hypothetical protein